MNPTPTTHTSNNVTNTNTDKKSSGQNISVSNPSAKTVETKVDANQRLYISGLEASNPFKGLKLSPQVAQLLHNHNVVLIQQQQLSQLFSLNMLATTQLKLQPQMHVLVRQWLTQESSLKNAPKELIKFLKEQLGIDFEQNPNRLIRLSLQQMLTVQWLKQDPILEISSQNSQSQLQDKIQNLIQFILPIPLQDKATVLIKQHEKNNTNSEMSEGIIQFEMAFDLSPIGKLNVQVKLDKMSLETSCLCSSLKLLDKTEKHWPLLQQRLETLGFDCKNTFKIAENESSAKLPNHKGLINLKV